MAKVGKETKSQNQLEVLDVAWDETAGVDALDDLLVDHFAAEFRAKHAAAGDITSSPRALSKLRKEVQPSMVKSFAQAWSRATRRLCWGEALETPSAWQRPCKSPLQTVSWLYS